jgi:hypothetical protein
MSQMRLIPLLALAIAIAASGCAATVHKDKWPPSWYHKHEGPKFEVLKTEKEVEQRRYPPSKWIATEATDGSWDDAWKTATKRLDDYWGGGNEKQQKVDKTVPTFSILYPTGQGKTVQAKFTYEYFLPQDLQEAPPKPTAQELKVEEVPGYDVWIKVFGGFASEKDVLDQGSGFINELKQKGIKVREDQFGVAIYDDPIQLVNRHNEIWVWEEAAPSLMDRIRTKFNELFSTS